MGKISIYTINKNFFQVLKPISKMWIRVHGPAEAGLHIESK